MTLQHVTMMPADCQSAGVIGQAVLFADLSKRNKLDTAST